MRRRADRDGKLSAVEQGEGRFRKSCGGRWTGEDVVRGRLYGSFVVDGSSVLLSEKSRLLGAGGVKPLI